MRRDGGRLQVFRERGHHLGRHRTCPSDTQETIFVRARSISKLRVTKASLGSSTRLALRRGASPQMRGPDQVSARRRLFRAPLMHQFLLSPRCTIASNLATEARSLSAAFQPEAPTWRLTLAVSNLAQHALTKGVFTRIRRRGSLCPSKRIRRTNLFGCVNYRSVLLKQRCASS
jgi:hypothetical protein